LQLKIYREDQGFPTSGACTASSTFAYSKGYI